MKSSYEFTIERIVGHTQIRMIFPVDSSFRIDPMGIAHIEVSHIMNSNKNMCLWDNIDFFVEKSKKEIKKECKQELIDKDLHAKGFFKELREMIQEALELKMII